MQLREEAEAAIAEAAAKPRGPKRETEGRCQQSGITAGQGSSRGKNRKMAVRERAPSVPTIPATKAAPTAKPLSPPKAADKPAAAKHAEEVIPQMNLPSTPKPAQHRMADQPQSQTQRLQ